jgi:hypothetical protein
MSLDGFRHSDYVCTGTMCRCWNEYRTQIRQRIKEEPLYIPPKEFLRDRPEEWSKEEHVHKMEKEKEKKTKHGWEKPFKKILGIKDKKNNKLNTIDEHKEAILNHIERSLEEYTTLFGIRLHMINGRLCPRCGYGNFYPNNSSIGIRCYECGFYLTEKELETIINGEVMLEKKAKRILLKRLKQNGK